MTRSTLMETFAGISPCGQPSRKRFQTNSEDEEAGVWHLPAERRMLAGAGIATLVLTRRPWGRDDAGAATIGDFLREVTV